MEEIQLIKKLESMKSTKPSAEWASFAKREIISKQFEKEGSTATFVSIVNAIGSIFETPRVFAPVLAGLIVFVFGFALITAQTVPGDGLYSLKNAYDEVRISMLSPEQQAVAQVKRADRKLSELDKIAEGSENQGKLAAGIAEVQKALVVASKELAKLPEGQKAELVTNIVSKITKIEKTTNAAIMNEKSEGYQEFYKFLAESEINELEANVKNLTRAQLNLLAKAIESFGNNDYSKALELLHQIQPETK
jgi:hypothetical protein